MWKQIGIAGALTGAVLGAGSVAMAATGGHSNGTKAADHTAAKHARKTLEHRALHLRWVGHGKKGSFVAHDAVRGTAVAVSPTSITVKAADGFTQTYVVGAQTKVRVHGSTAAAKITAVKLGDRVGVAGTESGKTLTAMHVRDGGPVKAKPGH